MVSIVIPYYNRPEKLNRALKSVFEQTYKNFEVLLIDDCSDTEPQLSQDHNVSCFRNSENKGPGFSRNFGMQKAKGNYIVFLDADDYWHEDYLSKTVSALEKNPECIMAYANGYYVDDHGNAIEEMRHNATKSNTILPNIFVDGRPWGTAACLWDLSKLNNVNWVETRCWEDYVFDTNAAIICNKVVFVEAHLVNYDMSKDEQKLSRQRDFVSVETNRNLSLLYIVDLVKNTKFSQDRELKKSLIYHANTNAIALFDLGVKTKSYYKNIKKIIKILDGKTPFMNIRFLLLLNKKIGLKLLRYFRKINLTN